MTNSVATRRPWFGLNRWFIINTIIVLLLLWLPYHIFGHRLYIGGDDTRLYYAFPDRWLHEFVRSTWFNFSNVGSNNPQFAIAPLLLFLSFFKALGLPPYALEHLAFSGVFIGGFLAFQAFFRELTKTEDRLVPLIIALGYVFSPILLANEYNIFLQSVWLIPLFPLWGLWLTRYLRTGSFGTVLAAALGSALLAYGVSGIPWVVALALPLLLTALVALLGGVLRPDWRTAGRFLAFWLFVGLAQAFWLVPFVLQLGSSSSFVGGALGADVVNSFAPTVNSVSSGMNSFYPLVNLFHHQIQIAFNWQTWDAYATWFDHFLWLDLSYPIVLGLGLWASRKRPDRSLTLLLIATVITLFFFTVNLGWFKALFLWLGHLPGFGMFRNYFSKFPLAYVFVYLLLIGVALQTVRHRLSPIVGWLATVTLGATILLNTGPFWQGQMFNAPVWTSKATEKNPELPAEYLTFMDQLRAERFDGAVLSLPFNIASYSYIQNERGRVFLGRSPVQLFSGVLDYSGDLSFPPTIAARLHQGLKDDDVPTIQKLLYLYDINGVLATTGLTADIRQSYPFGGPNGRTSFELYDVPHLVGTPVLSSTNGTYTLYDLPQHNQLIRLYDHVEELPAGDALPAVLAQPIHTLTDTVFVPADTAALPAPLGTATVNTEPLSHDHYRVNIQHLAGPEFLAFADTFDTGWQLQLNGQPIAAQHLPINLGQNGWLITPDALAAAGATQQSDGSISATLTLVFQPQRYLADGIGLSLIALVILTGLWVAEPLWQRRDHGA